MPIYEFLCLSCRRKASLFVRSISASSEVSCPSCGSKQLERIVSRFAFHKSLKSIHEESGDPEHPSPDYYKDPRNIGRWVEKKFHEMGQEMPSSIRKMIDAAREGDMPGPVKELQPNVKEI